MSAVAPSSPLTGKGGTRPTSTRVPSSDLAHSTMPWEGKPPWEREKGRENEWAGASGAPPFPRRCRGAHHLSRLQVGHDENVAALHGLSAVVGAQAGGDAARRALAHVHLLAKQLVRLLVRPRALDAAHADLQLVEASRVGPAGGGDGLDRRARRRGARRCSRHRRTGGGENQWL